MNGPNGRLKKDLLEFFRIARRAKRNGRDEPEFNPRWLVNRLKREQQCEMLLITSEILEVLGTHPAALQRLYGLLRASYDQVYFLLVIRNVIDYLNSSIQQRVKTFRQDCYGKNFLIAEKYSLDRRLHSFIDGDYKLIVEDFDHLIRGDTKSILGQLFHERLDYDGNIVDAPAANQGIGSLGMAMALGVNFLVQNAIGRKIPRRWMNRKRISNIMVENIRQAKNYIGRFNAFNKDEELCIISEAKRNSRQFIAKTGLGDHDNIFKPSGHNQSICLISKLPDDEAVEIRSQILGIWNEIAPIVYADFSVESRFDVESIIDLFLSTESELVLGDESTSLSLERRA
jgi:hypothetical protein